MPSWLDNRIPPPVMTLLTGVTMIAVAQVTTPTALPAPLRFGLAAALFAGAGLFGAPAIAAFRRARTTINPVRIESASTLVSTGIYGISRNPMYVGLAGLLFSLAIGLARPWLLLGPLAFVLFTTRFQIIPEERAMQARFGDRFTAYRARVRRWL